MAFLVFALVAGCGRPADTVAGPAKLAGSSWRAEAIDDRGVLDRPATTLSFDDAGRVAGSGGCNRYFGPVVVTGDAIRFGDIGSTMMACPPAIMDQEQRFHAALAATRSFRIDGAGQLVFLADDGAPLVRFSGVTP